MNQSDRIRQLLAKGFTAAEVAKRLKVKAAYVHTVRWLDRKKKKKPSEAKFISPRSKLIQAVFQTVKDIEPAQQNTDLVNHPPHYKSGGIETLDFIEAKDLNYRLGNVVKYVSRAGKKVNADPVQDLEKAMFYLKREIDVRKSA